MKINFKNLKNETFLYDFINIYKKKKNGYLKANLTTDQYDWWKVKERNPNISFFKSSSQTLNFNYQKPVYLIAFVTNLTDWVQVDDYYKSLKKFEKEKPYLENKSEIKKSVLDQKYLIEKIKNFTDAHKEILDIEIDETLFKEIDKRYHSKMEKLSSFNKKIIMEKIDDNIKSESLEEQAVAIAMKSYIKIKEKEHTKKL